jgi:hypothetical protein
VGRQLADVIRYQLAVDRGPWAVYVIRWPWYVARNAYTAGRGPWFAGRGRSERLLTKGTYARFGDSEHLLRGGAGFSAPRSSCACHSPIFAIRYVDKSV